MANYLEEALAPLHARLDVAEARAVVILQALHHIISKGSAAVDHDALLALAKEIDGKADAALSAAQGLASSHDVKTAALDDIGAVMDGIGPKLDQIVALAPVAADTSSAGASTVSAAIAP